MILIFFVLLIMPFSFFTLYATSRISSIMQDQTFLAARKTFDEAQASIRAQIEKVNYVMEFITYDDLVYRMASADPFSYTSISQLEDTRALGASFTQLKLLSGVSNIRLYVKNDYIYSNENRYLFSLDAIRDTNWYGSLLENPSIQWATPADFQDLPQADQQVFSCIRMLYNPRALKSPLAILRVDLNQEILEQALNRTPITENSAVLLLSGEQTALSCSAVGAQALPETIPAALSRISQDEWSTICLKDGDYYAFCTELFPTGWKLATVIPYSDIYAVSRRLRVEMILVMLLLAGAAYAIAFFLSDHTLRRVWQLSDTMQRVQNGHMEVEFHNAGRDEIGQLIAHFNHMMNRMRELMDEKVKYGFEIKNLELKALQAQINPHFLYNTLDTINCLAIAKDIPEITDVVSALATFYKISLSRGNDQIPIRDEVMHAKMYVKIQNSRFSGRIQESWDIAPEIEELLIIKIVLQPIIENAIIHGIFETEDSSGTITIRGFKEQDQVVITVSDNGVGMTPHEIAQNFPSDAPEGVTNAPGGYGVKNISDRLRIAYGAGYGLSVESAPGQGTTVTIRIPAVSPNPKKFPETS